ncbi:hypothetical protein Scep_012499 [Stephania cephalantha]|uniref:Uncharacterized protein n=1 Tax=Stephania cephalantha TaxID=152367 RepID=A0AAP0P9W8_9MAGN
MNRGNKKRKDKQGLTTYTTWRSKPSRKLPSGFEIPSNPTGLALQLQISTVGSLFFLHSLPLLPIPLPVRFPASSSPLASPGEFLHFYLHRKDPSASKPYFDLMLLPVSLCAVSAFLRPARAGGLARGVGWSCGGAWFVQMGFSFFTD